LPVLKASCFIKYLFNLREIHALVALQHLMIETTTAFHVPFWLSYILVYLFYLCPGCRIWLIQKGTWKRGKCGGEAGTERTTL